MNKETVFFLLGIVMAAAGCTLAPQYSRPAAPVPDKWEVRAADQASHIQALKWRQFYIDENLKQLIETALINNRDLRLSALSMERARGLYGIQRAEILPAVNAVGIGGKQHEGAAITEDGKSVTFEEYRADLRISSWEIDFFGRIRSLKDQALEEYLATEAARNSAQIALISSVAQTYLTLAADREALTIASSTLAAQQAAYDLMQQRYNVGVVSELDLKRVQTQVDSARGDIARYKQQVALDVNALGLLLGSQAQNSLLPSDLSSVAIPQEIFPGLNSEVLLSRPDILLVVGREPVRAV